MHCLVFIKGLKLSELIGVFWGQPNALFSDRGAKYILIHFFYFDKTDNSKMYGFLYIYH